MDIGKRTFLAIGIDGEYTHSLSLEYEDNKLPKPGIIAHLMTKVMTFEQILIVECNASNFSMKITHKVYAEFNSHDQMVNAWIVEMT